MSKNCISRHTWEKFTAADPAALPVVEAHCATCAPCTRLRDALKSVDRSLAEQALALVASAQPNRSTLTRIRDGITFRIRRNTGLQDQPDFSREIDFELLRAILVPMCGPAIAESALLAGNLGNIIDVICGSTAARLVEQTAQPLPEQSR